MPSLAAIDVGVAGSSMLEDPSLGSRLGERPAASTCVHCESEDIGAADNWRPEPAAAELPECCSPLVALCSESLRAGSPSASPPMYSRISTQLRGNMPENTLASRVCPFVLVRPDNSDGGATRYPLSHAPLMPPSSIMYSSSPSSSGRSAGAFGWKGKTAMAKAIRGRGRQGIATPWLSRWSGRYGLCQITNEEWLL